ncbi:hypothetical protein NGM29_12605 [Natronosalvus rutilus]|uniref:Uncharacterized protein n=1 Tax=Natronosalvus rutilus TaxID=2953753 RepID=A0A9E7N849_9EURY|nr:hypothetical protein [Natronosalvus rutilus]UTF52621.1 hypothetical protein NGM29_12605 [Natronosalvus rutilus]
MTVRVVFVSIPWILIGILLVAAAVPVIRDTHTVPSGTVQAMTIVGVVFAEVIVLYVGYGALVAIVEPSIRDLLGGDSAWNSSD